MAIACIVRDGERVLEGQRAVAGKAQGREAVRQRELHHLARRGASVTIAAVGVIIGHLILLMRSCFVVLEMLNNEICQFFRRCKSAGTNLGP